MLLKSRLKSLIAQIPAKYRQHPTYWKWKALLKDAESWSHEEITIWQDQQFIELVNLAYYKTKGYREFYDNAGVNIKDIRSVSDIHKLPLINKTIMNQNIKAFSLPSRFHHKNTTGGTTGEPFAFYLSREIFAIEAAFMQSDWRRRGWEIGDTSLVLRGSFVGTDKNLSSYNSYSRDVSFSSSHLKPEYLSELQKVCDKYKPRILQAYPSALSLLCDLIKKDSSFKYKFPIIFMGSENLYPWQIEKIQKTFPEARLHCWYGVSEKCLYAHWVPGTTSYEFNPLYGYAELLDDKEQEVDPGLEGELVGTGFFARATPFIRYQSSDKGVKEVQPKPGLYAKSLRVSHISGRIQEFIVTSSGRYISMTSMSIHSGLFEPIREFQFYQDTIGEIKMHYIPMSSLTKEQETHIENSLIERYGDDLKVQLVKVDKIARTVSGKFRYLDQRLDLKYHMDD